MAKKKAAKKKASAAESSFEEALAALTDIVEELDSGELALEESLDKFERGMALMKQCHAVLASAEKRVEKLTGFNADGEPETEPFDDVATADRASGDLFD